MSGHQSSIRRGERKLCCETLEPRQMLSANSSNPPQLQLPVQPELAPAIIHSAVDNSLGARDQALAISAVHLLIDGSEVTLTSLDKPLEMRVGSSLEVVGIEYRLNGDEPVDGKIAFEGYLNKLRGSRVRTDYGDGRFGGHVRDGELPFGQSSHPGLSGEWKMAVGTESLTLVMVRYSSEGAAVEDRITVLTQVGTPDFVIDSDIKFKGSNKGLVVGKRLRIIGSWGNEGEGRYRSYAEVDVYHESDPSKVVWSGTQADVVGAGDSDSGEFLNKTKRDGFSRRWMPELGGKYTLKFYADPENNWAESNEDNNVHTVEIEVEDLRQRTRGRDATRGFGFNHHNVADADLRDIALAVDQIEGTAKPTASNASNTLASQSAEGTLHSSLQSEINNAATQSNINAQPATENALKNDRSVSHDTKWLQLADIAFDELLTSLLSF